MSGKFEFSRQNLHFLPFWGTDRKTTFFISTIFKGVKVESQEWLIVFHVTQHFSVWQKHREICRRRFVTFQLWKDWFDRSSEEQVWNWNLDFFRLKTGKASWNARHLLLFHFELLILLQSWLMLTTASNFFGSKQRGRKEEEGEEGKINLAENSWIDASNLEKLAYQSLLPCKLSIIFVLLHNVAIHSKIYFLRQH